MFGFLTFFGGQTLQRPLQESAGSVTLTLLEQEGPVAQPHRLTLTETLHHRLIQAFCLLEKHMRQGHVDISGYRTVFYHSSKQIQSADPSTWW